MSSSITPDFRNMNKVIEQFKKKPAAQAAGNRHLANSQTKTLTAENATGAEEKQVAADLRRETQIKQEVGRESGDQAGSLAEAEATEMQGRAESGAMDGLSDYQRENCVLARDGRVVERIQMEYEVEHRLRNKLGVPPAWALEEDKIAWHRRQLALLEKADAAPRCEHIFLDGTTCLSPRMKKHKYCYAHARMLEVRPKKLKLLPAEDENSIMWNIMEIQRALIDDEISEKKAGLLLYGQQLALIAVRGVTFKETDGERMVRAMPKSVGRELTRKDAKEERLPEMPKVAKIAENPTTDHTDSTEQNPDAKTREPQRAQRNTKEEEIAGIADIAGIARDRKSGGIIAGDESAKCNVFGDEGEGQGERGSPESRGIAEIAGIEE